MQSARAITINVNYDPAGAGAVNPSFDPNAVQLEPIFQAAADFYEDVFEDLDHTLNIDFWYTDLTNVTGDHDLVAQSGGRETDADIQIDTNFGTGGALRNYFYDPTPTETDTHPRQPVIDWTTALGTSDADPIEGYLDPVPRNQ